MISPEKFLTCLFSNQQLKMSSLSREQKPTAHPSSWRNCHHSVFCLPSTWEVTSCQSSVMTETGWRDDSLPLNENWAAFDLSPSAVTSHLHWTFPKTTINVTLKVRDWISTVKSVLVLKWALSNKAASAVGAGAGESICRMFPEFYMMKKALGLTMRLTLSISHKTKLGILQGYWHVIGAEMCLGIHWSPDASSYFEDNKFLSYWRNLRMFGWKREVWWGGHERSPSYVWGLSGGGIRLILYSQKGQN